MCRMLGVKCSGHSFVIDVVYGMIRIAYCEIAVVCAFFV